MFALELKWLPIPIRESLLVRPLILSDSPPPGRAHFIYQTFGLVFFLVCSNKKREHQARHIYMHAVINTELAIDRGGRSY